MQQEFIGILGKLSLGEQSINSIYTVRQAKIYASNSSRIRFFESKHGCESGMITNR